MADGSLRRDFWIVRSGWMIAATAIVGVVILLWVVPFLFNLHNTPADWLALFLAAIAVSFEFLVGRALWRRLTKEVSQ